MPLQNIFPRRNEIVPNLYANPKSERENQFVDSLLDLALLSGSLEGGLCLELLRQGYSPLL
jgi:hypothetical protein